METDVENYLRSKLMGGSVKLRVKKSIVPHKFDCQRGRNSSQSLTPRQSAVKRQRKALVEEAINRSLVIECRDNDAEHLDEEPEPSLPQSDEPLHVVARQWKDVGTQVSLASPYRSKGITCNIKKTTADVGASPIKTNTAHATTSPIKVSCLLREIYESGDEDSNFTSESDAENNSSDSVDSSSHQELRNRDKELNLHITISNITREPKMYLGIPKEWYPILEILDLPQRNIFLTLMKIKLNDSFERLGNQFGISKSSASMVFQKTIFPLAHHFKQLIYWPSSLSIKKSLPIPFRSSFFNVSCILDCLEIEIQKPSNPVHQAMTWSDYKKCNTLKYLISSAPDGLITFISNGYGGRTSDTIIFENCGILEKLTHNSAVMADRGFKHIDNMLSRKGCTLVRPPSVSAGDKPTRENVMETKKIASLRIHVERVISRIREFEFLKAHSVIDHSMLDLTDEVITVACGLINLQRPIIKQ